MKHFALFSACVLLVACSNADPAADDSADVAANIDPVADRPAPAPAPMAEIPVSMDADDKVLITVDRLIAEDEACLVMMNVVNGTDETVSAGLFTFDVTGNGAQAGANMFPQTAEPQTIQTAQIVLPGADCANAKAIEGGQLNCKIVDTGESCVDVTELRDGVVDFTAND